MLKPLGLKIKVSLHCFEWPIGGAFSGGKKTTALNSLTVSPVALVLGGSLIVHYVYFVNEDHYKVRAE